MWLPNWNGRGQAVAPTLTPPINSESALIGIDKQLASVYTLTMLEDLNLNDLQNPDQTRAAIVRLLNLVEELSADNQALRAEVQLLRDENNRLRANS
ncbi:MAG: hypothetical protein HY741_16110 [Chloroflexi bacterium]|nr:hypothetical protein [Chloroflexota bacterium]